MRLDNLQRVIGYERAQASRLQGKLELMENQVIPQIAEARQALNHALEDARTAHQEAKEVVLQLWD